ncbi:MAG TPA: hypothetical protein VF064_16435 [Pyrinomonadaceae bacterium]
MASGANKQGTIARRVAETAGRVVGTVAGVIGSLTGARKKR